MTERKQKYQNGWIQVSFDCYEYFVDGKETGFVWYDEDCLLEYWDPNTPVTEEPDYTFVNFFGGRTTPKLKELMNKNGISKFSFMSLQRLNKKYSNADFLNAINKEKIMLIGTNHKYEPRTKKSVKAICCGLPSLPKRRTMKIRNIL